MKNQEKKAKETLLSCADDSPQRRKIVTYDINSWEETKAKSPLKKRAKSIALPKLVFNDSNSNACNLKKRRQQLLNSPIKHKCHSIKTRCSTNIMGSKSPIENNSNLLKKQEAYNVTPFDNIQKEKTHFKQFYKVYPHDYPHQSSSWFCDRKKKNSKIFKGIALGSNTDRYQIKDRLLIRSINVVAPVLLKNYCAHNQQKRKQERFELK